MIYARQDDTSSNRFYTPFQKSFYIRTFQTFVAFALKQKKIMIQNIWYPSRLKPSSTVSNSSFTLSVYSKLSVNGQLYKTDTFETVNGQLGSALYSEKYLKTEM